MSLIASIFTAGTFTAGTLLAQGVAVQSPFQNGSSGFYENTGVGFSVSIPGSSRVIGIDRNGNPTPDGSIRFQFGGAAPPPFGGYDRGADATIGIRREFRGGGGFSLNLRMGQGSSSSMVAQSPIVVVPNGGNGSFVNATVRPFVMGFTPVVNGWPQTGLQNSQRISPLQQALSQFRYEPPAPAMPAAAEMAAVEQQRLDRNTVMEKPPVSSADFGALSVAEIRRRQVAAGLPEQPRTESQREFAERMSKAANYESDGKPKLARHYYRLALRTLNEQLNQMAEDADSAQVESLRFLQAKIDQLESDRNLSIKRRR